MNSYMKIQIDTLLVSVDTFMKSLEMAALQDDKRIDKAEAKALRRAKAASERYKKRLLKIKETI